MNKIPHANQFSLRSAFMCEKKAIIAYQAIRSSNIMFSMSKIILIGGQLATGKTTLARSISKTLNIPFFYKDVLKEILADNIGYKNREENKQLSVAVFNIFLNIIENAIASNTDVILESNFKQNEIDKIKSLISNSDCKIISIVLYGNDDILYERYLNRFKYEHRHPAHANFSSKEKFNAYNLELKKVKYIGDIYEYNADQFIDSTAVIKTLK